MTDFCHIHIYLQLFEPTVDVKLLHTEVILWAVVIVIMFSVIEGYRCAQNRKHACHVDANRRVHVILVFILICYEPH